MKRQTGGEREGKLGKWRRKPALAEMGICYRFANETEAPSTRTFCPTLPAGRPNG